MNLPTQKMIEVTLPKGTSSIATKYRKSGAHLLVFMHGFGCAKECFDDAFADEKLQPYSILTFDWVGHGSSDKPDDFSYTMSNQADVALQIIEPLEEKTITIVAHSMGGAIGLLCAQRIDSLTGFINVEGNLVSEDAGIVSRRTADQSEESFRTKGFDDFLRLLDESERDDYAAWASWYRQASSLALHRSAKSLVEWSDNGKLLEIFNDLPNTLYIYGDEDSKDYLLPRFKSAKAVWLEKSGHFMMLDQPRSFYSTIASFLA